MRRVALIDADIIAHAVGWIVDKNQGESGEVEPLSSVLGGAKGMVKNILNAVDCEEYELYLTGKDNFRMEVYADYKAHRVEKPTPSRLKDIKDYLINRWDAEVINGMEADDMLGIRSTTLRSEGHTPIICSIDKDLNMIEGLHYNWHAKHKDNGIYEVTELEALRTFYKQVLQGDSTDNIPGIYNMTGMRCSQKIKDHLNFLEDEKDMYQYCLEMYNGNRHTLEMICKLIYIRKDENAWRNPFHRGMSYDE